MPYRATASRAPAAKVGRRTPYARRHKYTPRRRYATAAPAKPFRIAAQSRVQTQPSLRSALGAVQASAALGRSVSRARANANPEKVTITHIKGNLGISTETKLKMTWGVIQSGSDYGTSYILANTIIDPALTATMTNFQYTQQWANFYNYYQVHASRFRATVSNIDPGQPKILVVWPSLYLPGTGNIPQTLEAALHFPNAKHMYIGSAGSAHEIATIDHYVDINKFMAEQVPIENGGASGEYVAGSVAGRMPSALFLTAATQPSVKLYWVIQLYPTNNSEAGDHQQDLIISLDNYVTLFGTAKQTDISMLNQSPEWLADNPDYQPPGDPLDPGGTVPVPIFQTVVTKKYSKDFQKDHPSEIPVDLVDSPEVIKEDIMTDSVLVDRIVQAVKNSKK